jgi:hypothetical protein
MSNYKCPGCGSDAIELSEEEIYWDDEKNYFVATASCLDCEERLVVTMTVKSVVKEDNFVE